MYMLEVHRIRRCNPVQLVDSRVRTGFCSAALVRKVVQDRLCCMNMLI